MLCRYECESKSGRGRGRLTERREEEDAEDGAHGAVLAPDYTCSPADDGVSEGDLAGGPLWSQRDSTCKAH